MDQVDGCYGGTLVRGPLFSLPGGSGSLRPEDVDRGVEQLEAGRRDAPAASRIDHCEESASSPSRGPRAGPSPIKSSPTAAARKYYGDEDGGDKHGGCVIASRCGGGNVKEADSQDVGVGEREPDSDDRGQEGEGGHHARRRRYKPCSNGQDDDEQAMAGLRVEKGEGEAEPDAANRRGVRERAVEEEVDALSRQEDAVLHGESSTRESGRRSSMINQGAICAAVVGAAALTAAASRSREPQDLVGAVTSICTLLASAMAIMSFSRRG